MAQADLFGRMTKGGGTFELLQKTGVVTMGEYNNLLTEALEREGNIYETKKKMLQSDTKSLSILKKMKDISTKIYQGQKTAKDMQTSLFKQEQAIESMRKKAIKTTNVDEKKLYDQIIKRKKVELLNNRLILDQTRRTIPVLGNMGKAGAMISDTMVGIVDSIGAIIPIVGSIISGILKLGGVLISAVMYPLKKTFDLFLNMQNVVGNLAADIGLTAKQSNQLLMNMGNLTIEATKFGGTMEDVAAIINTFSNATGKNRLFSKEEIGSLVELGLGTGLGVKGAAELASSFDNIGQSLERTIKLTDKARDMAARYNVNTTKVLVTYKSLVESLTGIGFGKGLENLAKLAAKAEAIRFDLTKSVSSFTDSFFDPEKATEASAQMQVLGGKFAASFGDPISLAFQSMNDPTALAEKFADTVKGIVRRDKNGDFFIPPESRKQLQLASQALGQDYENIKNSAIEQAKIADKMTALTRSGISLFHISDDDKPALASLMNLNKNGQYTIKNSAGVDMLLSQMTDKNQIEAILSDRKKNDESAIQRKNLMERLGLIVDRFMLGFTTVLNKLFGSQDMNNFLSMIEKAGTNLASFISENITGNGGIVRVFQDVLAKAKGVFDRIVDIFSDKQKGLGQKIGESLMSVFSFLVKPLLQKLIEFITPLFKAGFGALLTEMKGIPIIGNALNKKGLNMQAQALSSDKSGLLNGIFSKEESANIQSHATPENKNHSILQGIGEMGNGAYKGGKLGAHLGTKLFGKGLAKIGTDVGIKGALMGGKLGNLGMKLGGSLAKTGGELGAKTLFKHIPILGSLISAGFSIDDLMRGDYAGAALQGGSALAGLLDLVAPGVGTAASLGLDGIDAARNLGAFDDGVIYKDGAYGKFGKGDMVTFMDQDSFEKNGGSGGGGGGTSKVEHSGTIIIKSDDGKVVTWEQMYHARDLIGGRIASINNGYSGGFGNYQDSNISPIKPLL